ncbi:MAG: 3-oxoacyl-ACP reductase FabG [candidate division Zixibacteria bacterium]|nr:3-oxoacyl-ACP reductase FabG [candidate division Zixibacteria bacterium]
MLTEHQTKRGGETSNAVMSTLTADATPTVNRTLHFRRNFSTSTRMAAVAGHGTLRGKVALVSGASHGIGRAIAIDLAREGASVVVNYCTSHMEAENLCTRMRAEGGVAYPVGSDVADAAACNQMVEEALAEFGRIDILVNNAGVRSDAPFHTMHRHQWDAVMRTNLDGIYNLTRATINPMRQRGYGRIVFITESSLRLGAAAHANLSASKMAIAGLARGLAEENARLGITVNCVCPGVIETRRLERFTPEERDQILSRIPLGRFGHAEEVANLVRFLVSDNAAYITGQEFRIDGGLSLT